MHHNTYTLYLWHGRIPPNNYLVLRVSMCADKFIDILGPHKIAYLTYVQRMSVYPKYIYIYIYREREREREGDQLYGTIYIYRPRGVKHLTSIDAKLTHVISFSRKIIQYQGCSPCNTSLHMHRWESNALKT